MRQNFRDMGLAIASWLGAFHRDQKPTITLTFPSVELAMKAKIAAWSSFDFLEPIPEKAPLRFMGILFEFVGDEPERKIEREIKIVLKTETIPARRVVV